MSYASQRKTDSGDYQIIFVILIAILFKIVALNRGITFDEALSMYLARQPLGQMMYYHLKGLDLTFPFFNYILSLWLKITFSLIWARVLSLIFGTLVIYISYRLAKSLFNKETALVAACLIACSEIFIFYSVEVRQYSLFTLLALLSSFYFIKLFQNPTFRNRFLYTLFTVFCIYCHSFGIFMLVAEVAFVIFNIKKSQGAIRGWLFIWAGIMLFVAPLAIYYINQYKILYKLGSYVEPVSLNILPEMFTVYLGNKYFLFFFFLLFLGAAFLEYKISEGSPSPYQKIRRMFLKVSSNLNLSFTVTFFCLPVALAIIISSGSISFIGFNYLMPFSVFFYFLIAKVLTFYKIAFGKILRVVFVLAVFLNAMRYSLLVAYSQPKLKAPDKVVEFLHSELKEGDLIVSGEHIYYTLEVFAYLNAPLKILVSQKAANDAKAYRSDFLSNNFLVIDKIEMTENSSFAPYKRVWVVLLDKAGSSSPKWFTENKPVSLEKAVKIGGYTLELYDLFPPTR